MKRLLNIFLSLLFIASATPHIAAQDNDDFQPVRLDEKAERKAAAKITAYYDDWKTVTLSGKLHIDGLPISPSAKIYMERGKKLVISLRAPLLGEVGTLEADSEQVTIVNKMNKTYCRENISALVAELPVTISDLQDIFLARIFLPGYGTLSMDNYMYADYYTCDDTEGWFLVPVTQPIEYDVTCAFNAYADGRTSTIYVTTLDKQNQATAEYTYEKKSTEIDLTIRYNSKDRKFGVSVNSTDFGGKPVKAAEISGKYRKVGLKEFFKQMM